MLMKDGLNVEAAKRIATAIAAVYPTFEQQAFINTVSEQIQPLELKQRLDCFIDTLALYLPKDFSQTQPILMELKPHWHPGTDGDPLRGFAAWPLIDYIARHGLAHPALAFAAMKELTSLFSAEFAIRHFINADAKTALSYLHCWLNDEDEHVRRLVSEGSRPRLPWGIRLQQFCQDPTPCLPLLNALKDDPSEYVRRSVANHLNDIAKDNPDIVIQTCQSWAIDASTNTLWVIKHACRTLIKTGHSEVFPLLGFAKNPAVTCSKIELENTEIKLGEALNFEFKLTSTSNQKQKLAVDYVIYHVKANGQLSAKVFKLKELSLSAGASVAISKRHPIKAITTRTYYSGEHRLAVQINGKEYAKVPFQLKV